MSECEGVGNVKEHGVDDVRGVRAAVRTHDFQPDRVGGAYHACEYKTHCNKKFVSRGLGIRLFHKSLRHV